MEFTFDHVATEVPDIAGAVDWYRANMTGVKVLYQDATWALIEANGARLAFVTPGQHPGHLAWRVDDSDLDRLAERHGKIVRTHRDRSRSFYLDAPGGAIEIISYPAK